MKSGPFWLTLGQRLAALFGLAVPLNYAWELAQSPMFAGMSDWTAAWWHCFVASLGDGFLVLLIYAAGSLLLRNPRWHLQPGRRGYLVMCIAGLAIGVTVEWVALHLLHRWSYSATMPLLPGLGLGLVPIAQMIVLPPIIFRIVAAWEKR